MFTHPPAWKLAGGMNEHVVEKRHTIMSTEITLTVPTLQGGVATTDSFRLYSQQCWLKWPAVFAF